MQMAFEAILGACVIAFLLLPVNVCVRRGGR